MKNKFNIVITILLIIFSFYYTKIVSDFIKNKDPLMIKIKEQKIILDKKPNNLKIKNDYIILGSKGKIIDINKSYSKMKKINKYDESLLVYKGIEPNISIKNIYDKVIINGSPNLKYIVILLKIDNIDLLKKIKDSNINIILNKNFINNNINYLNQINNNIVVLEQDNILNIKRIDYCYIENSFKNYCGIYNKWTIKPIFITHDYYYNTYNNLTNGKIFAYNILNEKNLEELKTIISAIKNLNYEIVSLDKLIDS